MGLLTRLPAGGLAWVLLGTVTFLPRPGGVTMAVAAPPVAPVEAQPAPLQIVSALGLQGQLTQGGYAIGRIAPGEGTIALNGDPVEVAPDGRFLIAFDRDAPATATLQLRSRNGDVEEVLSIAPRGWNISRLPSLPRFPVASAEFEARRPGELAQINASRRIKSEARGWSQPFLWPVTGRVSTLFGSQRIYKNGEAGAYHSGVDVARPTGTVIVAPADGVVTLAAERPFTIEGNLLMVDHGMGLNSAFLHLSRIDVAVGQTVRRGQPIGAIGATGRATGPHLHWGMKWREARIDPLLFAGPMPAAQ